MFGNKAKICAKRAEDIIKKDKRIARDDSLCDVIKSDFINILSSYVEVDEAECDVNMLMRDENCFELVFKTKCNRIKNFLSAIE